MVAVLTTHCNIFGAESGGGRMLGGLDDRKPSVQWFCPNVSVGRFRMTCEHGHKGQIMELCERHYRQFSGGAVQFCPRCNIPPGDHRCKIQLKPLS